MSDSGRTRLEVDDNDLVPQQQAPNALVPWDAPEPLVRYESGKLVPYKPGPPVDLTKEGIGRALYDVIGARDLEQAYRAYQRGEYLPALGQGAWGAAQALTVPLPGAGVAAKAGATGAKVLGEVLTRENLAKLLADEAGTFKAFHGSRAKFEEFLDEFMSSGEGGQAFSWGHYVGGHPVTGEFYQKSVGRQHSPYFRVPEHPTTGEPLSGVDLMEHYYEPGQIVMRDGWYERVRKFNKDPKNPDNWSVEIEEVLPSSGKYDAHLADVDKWETVGNPVTHKYVPEDWDMDAVAKARKWKMREPGYFYDVWVKPEHHEMLDWFQPFSKQEPGVQEKLKKIGADPESIWKDLGNKGPAPDMPGSTIYASLTQNQQVKWPHNMPRDIDEMRRLASKKLDAAGIPGTRFWDQFSRKANEYSMSYVGQDLGSVIGNNQSLGVWLNKQMKNSADYQELLNRVASRHSKEHSNIAINGFNRGLKAGSQEFVDYMTKQLEPYKNLHDYVKNNPTDFMQIPNPTPKTYNYVLYDPRHLEITHRDGRRLIPVEDDPKFPEKYEAYTRKKKGQP